VHRQPGNNRAVEESEGYDLAKSKKSVRELYPVIKDAHGNVIDGFHRLEADPNWKTETLEQIKTPVQLALARIVANTHRRSVSKEERKLQIITLAEELVKEGLPKENVITTIVELTTFSEQYVRKMLPDIYKQRPGVGGGSVKLSFTQDHEHVYDTGSTTCRICGRELTAPESVKAGIGPVCASGKPKASPEEIYATINDLYTRFENPNAIFVVRLLQQKHGLGYEGAQQALSDYKKNRPAQPPSPAPSPTKTSETKAELSPKEPVMMLVEVFVRESGNVTWRQKTHVSILPGQNLEINVNGKPLHKEIAVEPEEDEEDEEVLAAESETQAQEEDEDREWEEREIEEEQLHKSNGPEEEEP